MNKKIIGLVFVFLCAQLLELSSQNQSYYFTSSGTVLFNSIGYQETITAKSEQLKGYLNMNTKAFAFVVRNSSFNGFNSSLQQDHFNENYIESERFPNTSFKGKLIDDLDFTATTTCTVRAKGVFSMHGIEQDKIIKVRLTKKNIGIQMESKFVVLLRDFDILIPRIIHDKISPEINIEVNAELLNK